MMGMKRGRRRGKTRVEVGGMCGECRPRDGVVMVEVKGDYWQNKGNKLGIT